MFKGVGGKLDFLKGWAGVVGGRWVGLGIKIHMRPAAGGQAMRLAGMGVAAPATGCRKIGKAG